METLGSRQTLLLGQSSIFVAFTLMLVLWTKGAPYWQVAIPYIFLGIGVGLAGMPSSNSLTGSVPVRRVGMASGTADLQRDLGGALMTSVFGALLTAGYASAMGTQISDSGENVTENTQAQLQLSFAGAENVAAHHPAFASQITSAAQQSFINGDQWAYLAAMIAVLLGAALVYFFFPRHHKELLLHESYTAQDSAAQPAVSESPTSPPRGEPSGPGLPLTSPLQGGADAPQPQNQYPDRISAEDKAEGSDAADESGQGRR